MRLFRAALSPSHGTEQGKRCLDLRVKDIVLDGVKSMRNLMLATASAILLGLGMAGTGIGHAAEQYNTPGSAMQTSRTMTASEILIGAAQQQLKYSGLYNGSVDGKMSAETQRAFRQFQQQHGLRQSGTLDERTYTALQGDQGDTGQVGSSLAPGGQPSDAAGSDSGQNTARRHLRNTFRPVIEEQGP